MLDSFWQELWWLWRVALAALFGSVVGFERAWSGKPAGVRTHLAVSLGASVMSAAGAAGTDTTRIAAQVVTGIGFLGAGMLLRDQTTVRGLTSAASLWPVAGVGVAAGLGWIWLAAGATLLLVIALGPFDRVEHLILPRATSRWRLTLHLPATADAANLPVWKQHGLRPRQRSIAMTPEGQRAVFELIAPPSLNPYELIAGCRRDGASQVEWEAFGSVVTDTDEE